ncbi:MAG: tetratricopeptide repeat protein, partial [Anaerolineae bacterium]|nr:tetratricopeptide repeat protein [Anaerolineae bacterium]
DYAGALNTYNRALELDPDNPVVHQRLGYVYTQSGKLDEAKHHYKQAIEREENFAPALAGRGFVYRRLGEQAEKRMDNRNLADDERTQAMLERKRLLNQAEQMLIRALKLSPRLVDEDGESWWGVLGGCYKSREQIDDAIDAYNEATRVTPQSSYGLVNLALLYMKQNRRDEMLDAYEKVEKIARQEATSEQGNFWGYADLITSSLAIGKHEQALEALPIAISIAPVESPYMLEGLTDTLRDLVKVLEDEKVIHIQTAIRMLEEEMRRRTESAAD